MANTSDPLRTNDAAMKSILFGTPHNMMSSMSFCVMVGKSTTTPGKFTFFFSPNMAVFSHLHSRDQILVYNYILSYVHDSSKYMLQLKLVL